MIGGEQSPRTLLCGREIGLDRPLFLIAGPCVLESRDLALLIAERLARVADEHGLLVIFKASFDKANRTSISSFRGPGLDAGLRILEDVRLSSGLPLLTDVHEVWQVAPVAEIVDVLQTPAFLCRQTDLIVAAGASGRPVNIKKGQFLSSGEFAHVVAKARQAADGSTSPTMLACERGTSFGYNDLVSDMRSLVLLRQAACPVVYDATHSVQRPGAAGATSGGDRAMVPHLARAAVAVGVSGLFLETHPDPAVALSDAQTSYPLADLPGLVDRLLALDALTKDL